MAKKVKEVSFLWGTQIMFLFFFIVICNGSDQICIYILLYTKYNIAVGCLGNIDCVRNHNDQFNSLFLSVHGMAGVHVFVAVVFVVIAVAVDVVNGTSTNLGLFISIKGLTPYTNI